MNRTQKEQVVSELKETLEGAPTLLLTDFSGVEVNDVTALRAELRAAGVYCRVAKNTLIRRAIAGSSMESIAPLLAGPTALIWHKEEPASGAKVLKSFLKENSAAKVTIKGGWAEGDLMEGEEALKLADLLGKDELRAQILGLMEQVPGSFLSLLQAPARDFLCVLNARRMDLEENA